MRQSHRAWVFECEECGLLASNLDVAIPNSPRESAIDEREREVGLAQIRAYNNSKIVEAITTHGKAGGSLLDVGSGPGFLLHAARKAGFAVTGIEPDSNIIDKARAGGFDVKHGYFPDYLAPDDRFDVIVFNDVLEHIADAANAVAASRCHLAPNGLLVLNCPDRTGIFYRLASIMDKIGISGPFDRMWQRNLPSPHLWYFKQGDLIELGKHNSLAYVASVPIKALSFDGLAQRIFYVKGQQFAMSVLALIAAVMLIPLLSILPKNNAVVVLRKAGDGGVLAEDPVSST